MVPQDEDEDVVREVWRRLGFRAGGGGAGWSLVVAKLVLRDSVILGGLSVVSSKPLSLRSCREGECSCLDVAWVSIASAWIVEVAFEVVVLGWSVPDIPNTSAIRIKFFIFFSWSGEYWPKKTEGSRYMTLASTMTPSRFDGRHSAVCQDRSQWVRVEGFVVSARVEFSFGGHRGSNGMLSIHMELSNSSSYHMRLIE